MVAVTHVTSVVASVLSSARGDPSVLATKCYHGTKDHGKSTFGYGGATDCPDSAAVTVLSSPTSSHTPYCPIVPGPVQRRMLTDKKLPATPGLIGLTGI